MPISPKNVRIGGAALIAVLLVAGGYALPGLNFPKTKPVNAELTDELLANYVSKDTDGDQLPDWQESLYGTDIAKADTDGDGVTDGEAVRRGLLTPTALASQLPENPIGEEDLPGEAPAPGSFTERFSRSFFETYIKASGGQPLNADAQQVLINDLMAKFTSEAARSLNSSYTLVSIRTDVAVGITSYAGSVERVLLETIPDAPNSDMFVLAQDLIEKDQPEAAARLAVLGAQYAQAATMLLTIPAPPSYAQNHLRLIRALDQAGRAARAISTYKEDPLLTMGALATLPSARNEAVEALSVLAQGLISIGEPQPGTPGALILQSVRHNQAP